MKSIIKYNQNKNKLIIEIRLKTKKIVILGVYIFIITPTLFLFSTTIYSIFSDIDNLSINLLYLFLMNFILFFISLKYLKRLYEKEILILSSKYLVYKNKWLFINIEKKIILKNISQIKYIDANQINKHPLEGESFDYLGIGTSQKEVDFLIEDGKILLISGYNILRFGKNIDSEDGEFIIQTINNLIGLEKLDTTSCS